jgi:uncharacterized membrane protein YqjE
VEQRAPDGHGPAVVQSLRNLAGSLVALLRTRLELLATELEEERIRLARIAFWSCVALVFLLLGAVMSTLFVVVLFWDSHRELAVGLLALGYVGAGVIAVLLARSRMRTRSRLFSASLAELAKDQDGTRVRTSNE